jgi:hypothetical protein
MFSGIDDGYEAVKSSVHLAGTSAVRQQRHTIMENSIRQTNEAIPLPASTPIALPGPVPGPLPEPTPFPGDPLPVPPGPDPDMPPAPTVEDDFTGRGLD